MEFELELRTLGAEQRLWWYRGRRSIVLDAVRRTLGDQRAPRILDAGCGGGALLADLAALGPVVGLEPSPRSRERALARGWGRILDGTLERLPFEDNSFELATALDVLEHLDDDRAGLAELRRVLRPGGGLVVTVPAHPRLWSRHDDINHHRRRYTRSSLRELATATGWRIERLTHFNALLAPVAILARRLDRGDGLDIPAPPVNRALQGALELERVVIRAGWTLPFGLSLLAELRRPVR